MGHFSIRVVGNDGRPRRGVTVFVNFGIWHGHDEAYTDSDGWVEFSNLDDDLVSAELFINGKEMGNISTYSGKTYSFAV
jgi:hypothetical protein